MKTWPALALAGADFSQADTADRLQAFLVDYDVAAIEEIAADAWRVFFATPAARATAAAGIRDAFPAIAVDPVDVPDEDWAARSQASLTSVQVGNLVVAPPWDVPEKPKVQNPNPTGQPTCIVIQPSMGFGTGHHATTRLCLAALQTLDLRGRAVIDVGTGSGVLAIAASLLGADPVLGIDDDPDAIQAAKDNLALNPGVRLTFQTVDLRTTTCPPADLVVANLTGGLLASAAARLQELLKLGGHFVLSGLMEHEEENVLRGFDGYELAQRTQEDEWLCITLRQPAVW
jgi:ribosomal protein L11 methyltransferase